MINYPKKPSPSLLVLIGIPAGILFSVFSFLQIGFNFQDFKNNTTNIKDGNIRVDFQKRLGEIINKKIFSMNNYDVEN